HAIGSAGGGTFQLGIGSVVIGAEDTPVDAGQLLLTPDFFAAGFSNYDINGYQGITVADGTQLNLVQPVYQFTGKSFATPTGSDPSAAMQAWPPPLYLESPVKAGLTERGGASIALRSTTLAGGGVTGGAIVIGHGAAINVDPGQSVTLDAFGQITVDGAITAH